MPEDRRKRAVTGMSIGTATALRRSRRRLYVYAFVFLIFPLHLLDRGGQAYMQAMAFMIASCRTCAFCSCVLTHSLIHTASKRGNSTDWTG